MEGIEENPHSRYETERVSGEVVAPEHGGLVGYDPLEQLAGKWLASLHRKSPRTVVAYRRALAPLRTRKRRRSKTRPGAPSWFEWCERSRLDPLRAERSHVDLYAHDLARLGLAETSRAQRLAALHSFYDFAEREGEVPSNPLRWVERPRSPHGNQSPREPLERGELRRLLEVADGRPPLERALLYLLAHTGCRCAEACDAKAADLLSRDGRHRLRLLGKGNKYRVVPLADACWQRLDAYLQGRSEGHIFRMRRKGVWRPLDGATVWRIVTQAGRDAGIERPCHPHILRGTWATEADRAGVSLTTRQRILGHGDPSVTQRYTSADSQAADEAAEAFVAHIAGDGQVRLDPPATLGEATAALTSERSRAALLERRVAELERLVGGGN